MRILTGTTFHNGVKFKSFDEAKGGKIGFAHGGVRRALSAFSRGN